MNATHFPLVSIASRTRRTALFLASFALAAAALNIVSPAWSQDKIYKAGNDGVTQPKVLSKVDPAYTQEARDAHIEGTVVVKLVVTAEGVADDMQVVQGINPGLDQKAMEALAQWKFQPATKDGQPVSVYATVEVNFRLK